MDGIVLLKEAGVPQLMVSLDTEFGATSWQYRCGSLNFPCV
jgi:hypothetical protein